MQPDPIPSHQSAILRASAVLGSARGRRRRLLLGGALVAGGTLVALRPELVAHRFCAPETLAGEGFSAAAHAVAACSARIAMWLGGTMIVLTMLRARVRLQPMLGIVMAAVGVYVISGSIMADWHVDDAAITYAYCENLVRGLGLRLHPALPVEEAYSNTLWMLILAGARGLGLPIMLASKVLCTVMGALCVAAVPLVVGRLQRRAPPLFDSILVLSVCASAPFLIWSVSGLENALLALMLMGLVWAAFDARHGWTAALSAGLVLVRPEMPLVIAAVGMVYLAEAFARGGVREALRRWPLVVVPALTLVGLVVFRMIYFGDPMPTPFYAKASDATFLRLGNVFGRGWSYVLGWVRTGAIVAVVPMLLLARFGPVPRPVRVAMAIVVGEVAFMIYAGGDWMAKWRFVSAVTPMIAVIVGFGLMRLRQDHGARLVARASLVAATLIVVSTVQHMVEFRARPTTPYRTVAEIGTKFRILGDRLGIVDPVLAHHDAGGTTFGAGIELVDLGYLGHRWLAKHKNDPASVRAHLLDEVRPDFVFGSVTSFAAADSRFHETARFARDYVPLVFVDDPVMRSGLCHVRREHVKALSARGIEVVREQGVITEVRVFDGVAPRSADDAVRSGREPV